MKAIELNKKKNGKNTQTAVPKKRIALINSLDCLPLGYALQNDLISHPFEVLNVSAPQSAKLMRDGSVEMSLIPAIEYARKKETWRIVPGICTASKGAVKNVQMFFRSGLNRIKTVAIDPAAETSRVLLKILMREKFFISPTYISMEPNLEDMLKKADAALLVGNNALKYYHSSRSRLDLGEEWADMTGLPLAYSFWAGRELTVEKEDIAAVTNAFIVGKNNLETIAKEFAENNDELWSFYHDFLVNDLHYEFSDEVKEGLIEFYNYAFFYGLLEYIPDFFYFDDK